MSFEKYIKWGVRYLIDSDYRFLINARMHKYDTMSDEEYLNKKFKAILGYELNLNNPKTFNEKLQWLKLNDRKPQYTMMVDKYEVRNYIAGILGEEYLIPLLGVWEDPNDIDFDLLPDRFVLKCNHNSGLGMCICKDKSKINIKNVKEGLRKGLEQDYYLTGREWPYKDVPRKIICEKYMEDSTGSLPDYKVMCFDGKPVFIELHEDRFTSKHTQTYFDINWNKTEINEKGLPISKRKIEKPLCLEKMLSLSALLAKGIPHVRVDWYYIDEQLYFGELTFYDGSGFNEYTDEKYDYTLGKLITVV